MKFLIYHYLYFSNIEYYHNTNTKFLANVKHMFRKIKYLVKLSFFEMYSYFTYMNINIMYTIY